MIRTNLSLALPWWLSGKEPTCHWRRHGFDPWSRKISQATQRLSPYTTATEPVHWSQGARTAETHEPQSLRSTEMPAHRNYGGAPLRKTTERPSQQQGPSTAKKKQTHNIILRNFPGGLVVKNLPANAGDVGLIPGLGRTHMQWSNLAHAPQLLSVTTQSLSSTRAATTMRSPHTTMKTHPCSLQLNKATVWQLRPSIAKNK